MDDKIDNLCIGILIGALILGIIICIAQSNTNKRQAYRVYKENNLTIVEKAEE